MISRILGLYELLWTRLWTLTFIRYMYDAPSIYLYDIWPKRGWYLSTCTTCAKTSGISAFYMPHSQTHRHRSCITISQRGLLSGQWLVCIGAYADTHIHNHAWTQLNANTNTFQCILFTQIQTHNYNNSCQKKTAFWFGVRVCRLTPSTLPATRRDKLERVAPLQLCERSSLRSVTTSQHYSL